MFNYLIYDSDTPFHQKCLMILTNFYGKKGFNNGFESSNNKTYVVQKCGYPQCTFLFSILFLVCFEEQYWNFLSLLHMKRYKWKPTLLLGKRGGWEYRGLPETVAPAATPPQSGVQSQVSQVWSHLFDGDISPVCIYGSQDISWNLINI